MALRGHSSMWNLKIVVFFTSSGQSVRMRRCRGPKYLVRLQRSLCITLRIQAAHTLASTTSTPSGIWYINHVVLYLCPKRQCRSIMSQIICQCTLPTGGYTKMQGVTAFRRIHANLPRNSTWTRLCQVVRSLLFLRQKPPAFRSTAAVTSYDYCFFPGLLMPW